MDNKNNSVAAATALANSGLLKNVLIINNTHLGIKKARGRFFVEAKPDKKWKTVGGPFNDFNTADSFADNFTATNHVPTRVVSFQ